MRLLCLSHGGCRWNVIHEEWLPADQEHSTVRLLRFHECPWCYETMATITSPEPEETRCSSPERGTRWDTPELATP